MRRVPLTIPVTDTARVSGMIASPERSRGIGVVLGHGAGADMTSSLLVAVADGLAERGVVTLRFNFAYTEAGRRAPDPMPKLMATYRAAIGALRAERPDIERLVLGGKSMGGRTASMLAAEGERCDGLVFLGYPLHTADPKKPMRDAHLSAIVAPMLFVQGTRDALCDLARLRPVLARLGDRAALHVVEGGNHSLEVPKKSGRSQGAVVAEIIATIEGWIERVTRG